MQAGRIFASCSKSTIADLSAITRRRCRSTPARYAQSTPGGTVRSTSRIAARDAVGSDASDVALNFGHGRLLWRRTSKLVPEFLQPHSRTGHHLPVALRNSVQHVEGMVHDVRRGVHYLQHVERRPPGTPLRGSSSSRPKRRIASGPPDPICVARRRSSSAALLPLRRADRALRCAGAVQCSAAARRYCRSNHRLTSEGRPDWAELLRAGHRKTEKHDDGAI